MGDKNKMAEDTRMKSDMATMGRRDMVDKELSDNRRRNDRATFARRERADLNLNDSRVRNDKITADRRREKDVAEIAGFNPFFSVLIIAIFTVTLALTAYFVFA